MLINRDKTFVIVSFETNHLKLIKLYGQNYVDNTVRIQFFYAQSPDLKHVQDKLEHKTVNQAFII